ncbi:MAG: T9SS type A sorting domain-containing protein [Paludibacteraceae bacterium]|nr:T9SS type A sorting domain-containing protein [Paludibacteraceae bacterium]
MLSSISRQWLTSCIVLCFCCHQVSAWHSAMLDVQGESLVYLSDNDGFVLPDFSHAGYKGADEQIPEVPVVRTISAIVGDNTNHIQTAIDAIGAMPLQNGIRGALLLTAGVYEVHGTLTVPFDGVVLRGEDGAVLRAIGDMPHQRDVLVIGANKRIWGANEKDGTRQLITDNMVMPGCRTLTLNDAQRLSVGKQIIIYHPCTAEWLQAVNYGGVPYPDPSDPDNADERWTTGQYPIIYHRYITEVNGNTITLDAPVFYTLRKSLAQSYIYEPDMTGTIYGSGIENITIEIESLGGEDENHAWNAVRFRSIENAWAIDCTFKGFGQSGLVTEACRRSTFLRCKALDPVGITTGERKYNFNTYLYSQLNLFSECYARGGRHNYISNGTSGTSGNVFLFCVSDSALNVNEGHRGWTQGMLYDNHRDTNMTRPFTLGLYNRVAMGTGHGWAAVQSVLWNCDVGETYGTIGLQKPPTAQNYAIGCKAKRITGKPVSSSDFTLGYVEGQNRSGLEPQSLYLAQLNDRRQNTAVNHADNIIEDLLTINTALRQAKVNVQVERLAIVAVEGRIVCTVDRPAVGEVVSLAQLPTGMYFVYIVLENSVSVKKILL